MKTSYFKHLMILTIIAIICIGCDKSEDSIVKSNCIVSGTLVYNDSRGGWEIRETIPNTIDSVNIYIISKEYIITYSKDSTLKVEATGSCVTHSDLTGIPAGATLYDLYIENLKTD